ncbi:MAG: VanZ family protein [Planctomycetaceae bacterium]|nr:VanZ family protein [Planctomycetaceae bacterium]
MIERPRTPLPVLAAWVALIFGTSCTVVRPQEFFEFLHRYVFTDASVYEKFQTLWGVAWFAVVKGWHVAEFAILTWFVVRVIRWKTGTVTRRSIAAAMLCCALFAISDEWHQSFVPDRMGTATDVLIDCLGILAMGLALMRRCRPLSPGADAALGEPRSP